MLHSVLFCERVRSLNASLYYSKPIYNFSPKIICSKVILSGKLSSNRTTIKMSKDLRLDKELMKDGKLSETEHDPTKMRANNGYMPVWVQKASKYPNGQC
jgi:hypothetical protein